MFSRILLATTFLIAAGQYASGGVIWTDEYAASVSGEATVMCNVDAEPDTPIAYDSHSQSTGTLGYHGTSIAFSGNSAIATGTVLLDPQVALDVVSLSNSALPESPYLDGLLKPA